MRRTTKRFKLLICDLDNTLYDWVAYFVPSFYAMVDSAVELLKCDREQLLDDFREVHQHYHDAEHPYSLLETRTVVDHFVGMKRGAIAHALDPAFHAFNKARKKNLRLHSTVEPTLAFLLDRDVKLVAHTDSNLLGVADRLTRLDLTKFFSSIYCRERPNVTHPHGKARRTALDLLPMQKVRELGRHQLKPDPAVLAEICNTEDVRPQESAYVGDSIARDILMAKSAGVFSIWAKYGAILHTENYDKLVRVTHWTEEDVETERRLKKEAMLTRPDFVAEESFQEILSAIFPNEQIE